MTLLYVLYSPAYRAIKIGISDVSGRRFASHRTKGWILIKYWWFSERDKARAIETLVVQTLTKKYGYFLNKADMPQTQQSNSVNSNLDSIAPTNKQIRQTRKKLRQSEIKN